MQDLIYSQPENLEHRVGYMLFKLSVEHHLQLHRQKKYLRFPINFIDKENMQNILLIVK